ncbi:hypothetical protein SERLADRAFT_462576 [Serpula lacrymans var. lacrymans S7.9]|uniref:RBR-type E3 ubiquitin transferase n=1 Tax=Serpula lacrymans var. lacrymans (strain S7.9) TaxID=578457 RepID=F8NNY6_SERL9|nr:uncharacterized protein SERLADRAFT_462576 [Serpula lacrymans var. lacrymans S7.9]EGO28085.1 hypothetical protein SERLADRAFT_462576 [Serpula lacrymans var. lacrymans S7.9]
MRHLLASVADSNQFPLTCLGDESQCGVPIPIPTIQRFLPPASFSRLLEVSFDSHVARHPLEFKYCRTPDCTQIYRSACSGEAAAMQCPSCFSSVCAACHDDAHEGMSCEEFKIHRNPAEQERLNDEWISQQNGRVKKCPQCDVLIEKLEGCNHMECRCGAHVCWRCLGVFDPDTIYQHMHSAHGGIHGEDVVPEPVDFHIQQQVLLQAQLRQMELHREQVDEARIQQRRREAEQQLQRQRQEERVRAQRRQEQEERLRTLAREEYLQTQRRQEMENRLRAREGEMQTARFAPLHASLNE